MPPADSLWLRALMNEIGYRPAYDQRTVRVSFPSPEAHSLQPPNCDLFAAFRCQILTEDREDIFSTITLRKLSGTLNPIDEKPLGWTSAKPKG